MLGGLDLQNCSLAADRLAQGPGSCLCLATKHDLLLSRLVCQLSVHITVIVRICHGSTATSRYRSATTVLKVRRKMRFLSRGEPVFETPRGLADVPSTIGLGMTSLQCLATL